MARDLPYDQWYKNQELAKAPRGGIITPLSPHSVIGPPGPPSSNQIPIGQSKYRSDPRNQPDPWIEDVDSEADFYSPMQPLWPFGPPTVTQPRQWDYPIGYNLNYIPQRIEMMGMLRGMRASWGVLATIIATRQDQLLRVPWTIQRKDKPGQKSIAVDEMKKFFKSPDGKNRYSQWANLILDDLLVLDAPAIYFSRDRRGRPLRAQQIDGATIFPLIDEGGWRPDSIVELSEDGLTYLKRQPAFQQIIKGMPLVDLDESELMYVPMRPRPNMPMFGYPATEQIIVEASEAIRKTFYQLNFWAEGTIPDLIVTVPDTWTPRQIAMFQAHFDAILSGNINLKSKVRFLPGGMKPFDIKNSSGDSLWSQRDETLIRLACYGYSVSPTPFVKQVNRSVAQNSQQTAEDEGLYPLMAYWKDNIIDVIIQDKFGYDDIEMIFLPRPEKDGEKQAKIHQIQVKEGIRNRDEVRADLGMEPIEGGDVYTIELGNAIVPVSQAAAGLALPNQGGAENQTTRPAGGGPKQPANTNPVRGQPRPNQDATTTKLSSIEVDDAAIHADGDVSRHSYRRLVAGNYRKGHVNLHGLDISIENAYASKRGKKNPDGTLKWSADMPAHYGYIRGTIGADGDQVDTYIGRRPEIDKAFVIDQFKTKKNGKRKFDEHKVMLGYKSARKALRDYRATRSDGFGAVECVTSVTLDELKSWLKSGSLETPLDGRLGEVVLRRHDVSKADTISSSTGLLSRPIPKKRKKRKIGPRWLELRA